MYPQIVFKPGMLDLKQIEPNTNVLAVENHPMQTIWRINPDVPEFVVLKIQPVDKSEG